MASDASIQEIEDGLKRLLKMGSAKTDGSKSQEQKASCSKKGPPQQSPQVSASQPAKGNKKKPKKNKKGNVQDSPVVGAQPSESRPQSQKHEAEPPPRKTEAAEQTNQKKKKKRQKKKGATEKVAEKDMPETDSESDDAVPVPKKRSVPIPLHIKYLDDKLTPGIMQELESERIFPLKKKSTKFVYAKYFCRLCDYHCDNIPVCRQHYNDARHRRRREIMLQDKKLKNLPDPTERHATALDDMVSEMDEKYGLSEEDLSTRRDIVQSLELFLQQAIPGISLCMYGSSLSGFGLKTSDLNIDLVLPGDTHLSKGLIAVYQVLMKADDYTNVTSDFHAKVPSVMFQPQCGSVLCRVTVDNKSAYYTSLYLKLYNELDPRLKPLAVVFKHWAKICQVDQQEAGSLPAYTFTVMTVYFLQQCTPPVLPVLWKDISEPALKGPKTTEVVMDALEELKNQASTWKSENKLSVGTLWRNLLVFYGVRFDLSEFIISVRQLEPLHRSDRKWKSKKVAVEDPFYCKRNVARSLYNNRIFDYFYNCLRKACLYFSLPTSHPDLSHYYKCSRKITNKSKQSEHNSNHDHKSVKAVDADVTAKQDLVKDKLIPDDESSDIVDSEERLEGSSIEQTVKGKPGTSDVCIDRELKPGTSLVTNGDQEPSTSDVCIDEEAESGASAVCEDNQAQPGTSFVADSEPGTTDTSPGTDSKLGTGLDATEAELVSCFSNDVAGLDEETGKITDGPETGKEHEFMSSTDTKSEMSIPLHELVADCGTCEDSDQLSPKQNEDSNSLSNAENLPDNESAEEKVPVEIVSDCKKGSDQVQSVVAQISEEDSKTVNSESVAKTEDGGDSVEESSSSFCDSGSEADSDTPESSPRRKRKKMISSPVGAEYEFEFSVSTLTDGKGPSIFCQLCEKEGHLKSNCPEDQLPPLEDLQPVTKQHLKLLTSTVKRVPRDFKLSPAEIDDRDRIRKDLEEYIQESFPDAELCLFGSSMNGFGFHQSDLDICVTFSGRKQEDLNYVEVIEEICKKLKSHRGLYNVFPITTAKVPIVKFKHRTSQLEGDISLYNILAQHNTRLLHTYAAIDQRVQILGFAIKVFAKVCDIGDASKGSLSSYAYMLMMFHFLQHTKPPVIPVLQEMVNGSSEKPKVLVDGCNAWFYDDLDQLPQDWQWYGKNQQSVGELWLCFFRYYLEEFNLLEQVITIKQFEPLTKFEKLWNGKCVAIEDPFDLSHNLGGGLSRKMNKYIQQTFIYARKLYGTSVDNIPDGSKTMEDYFFDRKQLTDGEPPSDRLCRVCSKIGHIAKECPRVTARKAREASEKKRKEELRQAEDDRNMSTPNKNRDRSGYVRSHSESYDHPSPNRPRGQQAYYRQTSDQLADHHQGRGQMDANVDSLPRTRYPGTPPHAHPNQHMSQERHAHSQPTSPYSIPSQGSSHYTQNTGARNWLFSQGSPRGQLFRPNQNENSSRRYGAGQSNSYPARPYMDYGDGGYGKRGYPANGNGDYYARPAYQNQGYNRAPPRDSRHQQGDGGGVERAVNVQKGSRAAKNVGVTVRNEYYHGKEK